MYWLEILLLAGLILYFLIHLPFDIHMVVSRDRSKHLDDYGINSSDRLNATMGFISLAMWLFWLLLCINPIKQSIINSPLSYQVSWLQLIGGFLLSIGVFIACWARIARGRFAASWGLNDTIPLITHGPYRWIRHPSYFFYILMFIALPLISGFLPALILLFGIPIYYYISQDEEKLLVHHFGEEYLTYQKQTGRFFPFQ